MLLGSLTRILVKLDEYGNAQVLESTLSHWVIFTISIRMFLPFADYSITIVSSPMEHAISSKSFKRSFVIAYAGIKSFHGL